MRWFPCLTCCEDVRDGWLRARPRHLGYAEYASFTAENYLLRPDERGLLLLMYL